MRRRTLILFATLAATVVPLGIPAQDAAEEEFYEAAIAWVNLVVVEGDFEAAANQAHPEVAAQMTATVLEDAWAQLGSQLGDLVSLEPLDQSLEQGLHMVVLEGVFDAGTFDVQVFMGDQYGVAGFFVRPPGG